LHYYAKPGFSKKSHEQVSAELADHALQRLRYPTDLRQRVVRIVRAHMMDPGKADELRARRLLQRYGVGLTFDLLDHKEADLAGKHENEKDVERLRLFRKVVERERSSAHRVRDLAINGDDLLALGYKRGPAIGRVLHDLLDEVVRTPELNTRERLLERARELK
jgi:hypothetical protein